MRRWRTRVYLLAISAAIIIVAAISVSLAPRTSRADPVPGEYSLEVSIAPASANIGVPFTVVASIAHSGMPSYQAVQWDIDYDETMIAIDIDATARDAAAPTACSVKNDNSLRILVGCIDVFGANLSYSGPAWNVVASCTGTNGNAPFTLQNTTGTSAKTFVKIGSFFQPIHTHNDAIFCGPPPPTDTPTPTNTPLPPTFTPTRTPTPTSTPTRTPSPTPTVDIPPDQNQFKQFALALPSTTAALDALDTAIELEIGAGWNPVDSESLNLYGSDRLLSSLHRGNAAHRADASGDDFVDLTDVLLIIGNFGQPGAQSFKFMAFDPASQPTGAQLLAAIDAQIEPEILNGYDVVDSTDLTIGGAPRLVYALQLRGTPPSTDVNGDGLTDLTDALIALALFNTTVDPVPPAPLPPGPNRFRYLPFDPPATSATLVDLDYVIEGEISAGWDPVDSTMVTLDGDDQLLYSLQRNPRKHRADVSGDDFIDLTDVLMVLMQFGAPGINAFQYVAIDPANQPNETALLAAIDAQMEGYAASGWKVMDSAHIQMDGGDRILYALQLREIPYSMDVNGDGLVDFTDALITLALFNTIP